MPFFLSISFFWPAACPSPHTYLKAPAACLKGFVGPRYLPEYVPLLWQYHGTWYTRGSNTGGIGTIFSIPRNMNLGAGVIMDNLSRSGCLYNANAAHVLVLTSRKHVRVHYVHGNSSPAICVRLRSLHNSLSTHTCVARGLQSFYLCS